MNTKKKHNATSALNRRQYLKLAATSILVITGCTNIRDQSDLNTAMRELNRLLDEMDDNKHQQVTSIVQHIQQRARELADEHSTFIDTFDVLLRTYDTTEVQLTRLIDNYNNRRTLMRNDLLYLQDELHASMTPEDWSDVVRILNRAGKSLAGYTLSGN